MGLRQTRDISSMEVVKKFNISYHVLNHYTNLGLLPISHRKGKTRYYNQDVVKKRLKEIKSLLREGYPLHLIRKKIVGI